MAIGLDAEDAKREKSVLTPDDSVYNQGTGDTVMNNQSDPQT